MKTVGIVIARMGSSRLPGKILKPLDGLPVLRWVTRALLSATRVDEVWVATSTDPRDDVVQRWCNSNSILCFRGSENDVLDRVAGCARAAKADFVVRVTADCPFLDPRVIDEVVALREALDVDYASNVDPPTWPDGLDTECFRSTALYEAAEKATRPSDRNTVTQYISRNRSLFTAANLTCPLPGLHKERWVLDTENDYRFCRRLAESGHTVSYLEILKFLNENPALREINKQHPRNERFFEELVAEEPVPRPHHVSEKMLIATQESIPLGTQTYSKSYLQYPQEAPLFATHGSGGLIYDIDGNDYVDLVGGLLPNILGYRDPDVDRAVRRQLDDGVSLSVASLLEGRLAEKLIQHIPCAQRVRFGKNGTDVTTAAVRLARHCTGRDRVLSAGYHGWMDWSIAHDPVRNRGVPMAVRELTTPLRHGDIQAARNHLDSKQYACVIVEPETDREFLTSLRMLCNATGTLLVFDEIITGFRWGLGGAQSVYKVTPDLATFGKAMGNGMPISALVGLSKYMDQTNGICFSGTFFGEALSLAAALATIEKMEREPVVERLMKLNLEMNRLVGVLSDAYTFHGIQAKGEYLSRLTFLDIGRHKKEDIKTLFLQEMIKNGVLVIGSNNFCYAHTNADLARVFAAYGKTFETIKKAMDGNLGDFIVGRSVDMSANVRAQA